MKKLLLIAALASPLWLGSQAQAQDWAPISVAGKLHDRASFRYFWQVLERAHQTGVAMPEQAHVYFSATAH